MKFLIVGDLHGNMPKIHYKGFDAIIAPGDFCSDAVRKYMFEALRRWMKNPKDTTQWYDLPEVGRKRAGKEIKKSMYDGRKILKQLNSYDVPVYIVPGNWDWTKDGDADWKLLRKDNFKQLIHGLENVVDVYHKKVDVGEYEIIGHGITSGPEYPQYKEDLKRVKGKIQKIRRDYNEQYRKIDSLFKKSRKPVIFLSHNVPFNTPIDKITSKESPRYGYHYGSLIARQMTDKHQPLVCIGGHMHEHFRACRIGKTTAINAGFGSNVNVWLELSGNKIKKLEFYKST